MSILTPERVKEAYEKVKMIPVRGSWYKPYGNCGCAITACLAAECDVDMTDWQDFYDSPHAHQYDGRFGFIVEKLDLMPQYVFGFIAGFDSPFYKHPPYGKNLDWVVGYLHGREAAKELFVNE